MTFSFFNKPLLSGAEKDKHHYEFTLQHHKMEEKLKNTEVSQQKHFPSKSLLFPFVTLFQIQQLKLTLAVSTCALSFEYDYVQIFLNNSYLIIQKKKKKKLT